MSNPSSCLTRFLATVSLSAFALVASNVLGQGADSSDFSSGLQPNLGGGIDLPYRLYVPPDYDPDKEYPLMLWLHGWGERGTNNSSQLGGPFSHAIDAFLSAENLVRHPCIVIAPQLPGNSWWDYRAEVEAILDTIVQDYSIDAERRYLTGVSWGGMGAWAYLTKWPDYWAAAIPICGHAYWAGGYGRLGDIAEVPIWAFHAANDGTVGVEGTDDAIMIHRREGGNAHYTRYASAGHNAWTPGYQTPRLFEWLMNQRRDNSGTGAAHVEPLPFASIDTAEVGAELQLSGRIREEARGDGPVLDLGVDTVYWWSSRIDYEQRGWDAQISGRTITSATASYIQSDVGKVILLNHNDLDQWNGYEIVAVTNGNTVEVSEWLGSHSSVYWEVHGPGSRYAPVATTGLDEWSAGGIPLFPGENRSHIVLRADSQSSYGGDAWLAGDSLTVDYPDPAPSANGLSLSLDPPAEPGALLTTTEDAIVVIGTVGGGSGTVSLSWSNNRGGSGDLDVDGAWSTGSIPLKNGYNKIQLAARDADGAEVIHHLWVVRNEPPVAPPRQYLHAFPDSVQSIGIEGDFEDTDAWPAVRPFLGGVNDPVHGSVHYQDGIVEYTPAHGFTGLDRFTYEISDGFQRSAGVVTVSVGGTLGTDSALLDLDFENVTAPGDLVVPDSDDPGEIDDLSAETNGGTWSITDGNLRIVRPGTGADNFGAGFRRGLSGAEALVVRFELAVDGDYTGFWHDLVLIGLGDFSSISDYDGWINGSNFAEGMAIVGRGTNNMSIRQGDLNPVWEGPANGSTYNITWVVNTGDTVRSWQGPGGALYTLEANTSTLLVDGTLARANVPRHPSHTKSEVIELLVAIKSNAPCTIDFDSFSVSAVGDPVESGLVSWRESESLAPDGSDDGEIDVNGLPRLLNFAFGIDSTSGFGHVLTDESPLPRLEVDGDGVLTAVARPASDFPGLVYEAWKSSDLVEWVPIEELPTIQPLSEEWVRMRWSLPEGVDRCFYRVEVRPLD